MTEEDSQPIGWFITHLSRPNRAAFLMAVRISIRESPRMFFSGTSVALDRDKTSVQVGLDATSDTENNECCKISICESFLNCAAMVATLFQLTSRESTVCRNWLHASDTFGICWKMMRWKRRTLNGACSEFAICWPIIRFARPKEFVSSVVKYWTSRADIRFPCRFLIG